MKKSLVALLALAVCGTALADSVTLKFRNPTKAELKEMEAYFEEGSGDQIFFATNKGLWSLHIEDSNVAKFNQAEEKKQCVKVTASKSVIKEKFIMGNAKTQIVKCK